MNFKKKESLIIETEGLSIIFSLGSSDNLENSESLDDLGKGLDILKLIAREVEQRGELLELLRAELPIPDSMIILEEHGNYAVVLSVNEERTSPRRSVFVDLISCSDLMFGQ